MEKEVKLFDPKFVHFMWDDKLEGKKGFFADGVKSLEIRVKTSSNDFIGTCYNSDDDDFPFRQNDEGIYRFFYYDPNYEVKRAFYKEGKKVQFKACSGGWADDDDPLWCPDVEYRIKPEEEKHIVYLHRRHGYLTVCWESRWETVQKEYGAKTKLFVGTDDECSAWYKPRQKFVDVIEAWEDGKKIQFLSRQQQLNGEWVDVWYDCVGPNEPEFLEKVVYRVKPEEPKSKRMTRRQYAEWLAKGNGEGKSRHSILCLHTYDYEDEFCNEEIPDGYKIRRWDRDEWIEPTEREYLVAVKHVNPDMSPAEYHYQETDI